MGRDGLNGTSNSRTLLGRCVKTIVLTSPMRFAIRGATSNEAACAIAMAANDGPRTLAPAPKRTCSQYATTGWTMNPPPKASSAKRADSAASGLRLALLTIGPGAVLSARSEEHTSELQSHLNLVCRLLLEK